MYEYAAKPRDDPRPEGRRTTPWEAENGTNGGWGINAALLNDIGIYMDDVHGLKGAPGKLDIMRDPADALEEPRYELKL